MRKNPKKCIDRRNFIKGAGAGAAALAAIPARQTHNHPRVANRAGTAQPMPKALPEAETPACGDVLTENASAIDFMGM